MDPSGAVGRWCGAIGVSGGDARSGQELKTTMEVRTFASPLDRPSTTEARTPAKAEPGARPATDARTARAGAAVNRLLVISNRVSAPTGHGEGSAGGLAMALSAALREYSGIWFGWSGSTTPAFTGQLSFKKVQGVTVATMDLEEQDVHEYYNGFANKTLWPLFHYRIDLTAYDRSFSEGYARVNQRFGATLAPLVQDGDLIWIQDYHLIPLGRDLREQGVKNPIGFFLHIPWPARQLLTTLPRHRELVEALFAYDLIGFQTEDWLEAFKDYVVSEIGGEAHPDGTITAFGRTVRAGAFPIGIDAQDFVKIAASPAADESNTRMRESADGRQMIVGVDRLDYSKGLEERLLGYEQFLNDHEDMREKVFMLQIAPPSRNEVDSYQELRSHLDGLSGRINGEFSTMDWVPVRYVNRAHRRDELAGIYRAAAVALVTPLRDGMNLVAKEYVAAQDPEDPGVLILSRFAGAASQMKGAIIVNPFSREEMSEALATALSMPLEERKSRWKTLMADVVKDDVNAWRDAFVETLRSVSNDAMAARAAAH
jgi:trehalose 6-phosphate synthase